MNKENALREEKSNQMLDYKMPQIEVLCVNMESAIAGSIPMRTDNKVSVCMVDGGTLTVDGDDDGDYGNGDINILW